jgi:6-phosphogluconolactonase (cycloisomerase 2 family)
MTMSDSGRPTSAYAAVGAELTNYTVDVESGRLTRQGAITLPSRVQYAWPHASLPILYAACADRGADPQNQPFYLCALMRDEKGNLSMHGEPAALPARPIDMTTDIPSRHALVAYGAEPGLTVLELRADGTVGKEIALPQGFDFGTNPHQVRVTPSNDRAIISARGKKGFGKPAYVEGGMKVLGFDQGKVKNLYTAVPADTKATGGFNPRNLAFHPTKPWAFQVLEAQNCLCVFKMNGGDVEPEPLFVKPILIDQEHMKKRQDGGQVYVHSNGEFVYVGNRNDGYVGGHEGPSWLTPMPPPVFPGGENNIAVFKLDPETGEPTLIQHEDSRGLHPRTFALDAGGRILIAANIAPTRVQTGETLREIPANLAVFRIGKDGKLTFLHKLDLDVGAEKVWWMGVVG